LFHNPFFFVVEDEEEEGKGKERLFKTLEPERFQS
jgi:hypothetical protein